MVFIYLRQIIHVLLVVFRCVKVVLQAKINVRNVLILMIIIEVYANLKEDVQLEIINQRINAIKHVIFLANIAQKAELIKIVWNALVGTSLKEFNVFNVLLSVKHVNLVKNIALLVCPL